MEICKNSTQDADRSYTTLLTLHILEECFPSRSGEWKLLAKKAKGFLVSAGIQKPDAVLQEFTIDLKF